MINPNTISLIFKDVDYLHRVLVRREVLDDDYLNAFISDIENGTYTYYDLREYLQRLLEVVIDKFDRGLAPTLKLFIKNKVDDISCYTDIAFLPETVEDYENLAHYAKIQVLLEQQNRLGYQNHINESNYHSVFERLRIDYAECTEDALTEEFKFNLASLKIN